jgi:hypothetical protein
MQRGARSKAHNSKSPRGRFDLLRTQETGGSIKSLQDSFVSLTLPALSTHCDALKAIARHCQPPLAIESLDENLRRFRFLRGKTLFLDAVEAIEEIAQQHEGLHWWVSKGGLNVLNEPMTSKKLSEFDKFAGKLYFDGSKDCKLSEELLREIARALDEAGFTLKEELQPAQWKPISEYNQKHARLAVKSFAQACGLGRFVRSVRKRLYVARARYKTAIAPSQMS